MPGPLSFIVFQGTGLCNLNCTYCYLSEEERKQNRPFPIERVYHAFYNIFSSSLTQSCQPIKITWHVGEPLLQPISYWQEFIHQVKNANDASGKELCISFDIQTNGVLLNHEWCDFFKEHDIQVGISCDGPGHLHDQYRKTWNNRSTHQQVLNGMALLREYDIQWKALATVLPETLAEPEGFFQFFSEQKAPFLGLNFVRQVAKFHENPLETYLNDAERFLKKLFDLYLNARLASPDCYMYIREFEIVLNYLSSPEATDDAFSKTYKTPFNMLSIDVDGNFSTYDPQLLTAVAPQYPDSSFVVGNIFSNSLDDVLTSPKFQAIYNDLSRGVDLCQASCDYFQACNGCYPHSKQGEHGTFLTTETTQCCIATKITTDIIMSTLQQNLKEELQREANRKPIKRCGCGRSKNQPYCDESHKCLEKIPSFTS